MDPASWDKAKDIIFEAVGLPAAEREAFVRGRCDDPALCTEIMALLASGAAGDDFLASRTVKEPLPVPGQLAADADDLEIGTKVGPYVIVEQLGVGGMGRVFLGTDPRLQRRVALKCLLDSRAAGDDLRSRIIREARAAARISNQHVAVIHDVIEHESRAFIVMEYVEGETLSARIKRQRPSVAESIAIGRQLASALAAAHAEGIVHRDLKPSNIQLTHSGLVKILDFGIASASRLLSSAGSGAPTTRTAQLATLIRGANAGTPPYMSPEQLLGSRVDERSDIYSLGVVLFQMCTGQLPYPEKEAFQIAAAQAKGVPRADAINRDIPKPFADTIARAMAVTAEQRFQSALDVDSALEAIERPLKNVRVDRREQMRQWLGRLAVAAPAVILMLWVIGFITSVQFNIVFGRDGRFSRFGYEPWASYIGWGVRAVLPVAFVTALAAVGLIAATFVVRLLVLIGPVGRLRSRLHGIALEAGLGKSHVLAQALTGLGVATLAGLSWYHADLIRAWSSFFNSSPIENMMPMTDSAPARWRYHIQLSIATLVFAIGFYKVIELRRREKEREGNAAVAMLGVVIGLMFLMNEAPYRTFHWRDFDRADLDGARCYITGETADEFLVLCPAAAPPRNRTIRRDDPQLRKLPIRENVFKGINTGSAAR